MLRSLSLILLLFAAPAWCDDRFEALKARYLSLRNTDTEVSRKPEWEKLAEELVALVEQERKHPRAAHALLQAAILNRTLYERVRTLDYLVRAIRLLTLIEQSYREDPLADDALLLKGEIYASSDDDPNAKEAFLSILERYPKGDMVERARLKLDELEGRRAQVEATPAPRKGDGPLVVIDPGHGGEDFGASAPTGMIEKSVVLEVAKDLDRALAAHGVRVHLTRTDDVFMPLAERTSLANDLDATLFVSLHANASPGGKASGFEIFYLDNTNDEASRRLAQRENASLSASESEGDIQFILSDLIQNAKLDDSIVLAHLVNRSVVDALKPRWPQARSLGVRKAPFYVLVGAHMPCVLVELFFLDNPVDSALMKDPEFRKDLVAGLQLGVRQFLERAEPAL